MNEPTPQNSDTLERLLMEHLERQAGRIDAEALHARIARSTAPDLQPMPVRQRYGSGRRLRWAGGVSVAAILVLGGLLFWDGEQPLRASPQAMLQETQKTLLQPVYRCYQVEVQREAGITDETNPMLAQAQQSRLWTRGDRFWIETTFNDLPGRHNYWGRDELGNIRMTFGPTEGIEIGAAETPRWLRVFSDLCSMQPDRLIVEVLHDFNLQREDAPASSRLYVIKAEPKPGRWHPVLKQALLEIDANTKVLRRVVVHRATNGADLAATFTLVDTKNQDELQYPFDGRDTEREYYSGDNKPDERRRLLLPLFGHRATDSIKPGKNRNRGD